MPISWRNTAAHKTLSILLLGYLSTSPAWSVESTLPSLVELVRAGIRQHTPDKMMARELRHMSLKERLPLRYVEELESEGAGPETVAALEYLLEGSAGKPPSAAIPPFQSPARPTIDEQRAFFHRVDVNAIHYSKSLPNFICTEVVHRYQAPPGKEAAVPWKPKDVLTVKLTYFENREKYELVLVNGKKSPLTYESTRGAVSEGDFGSVLVEIFSPDSKTKFQWSHWTRLRGRLTRVYSYRTPKETSHYRIGVGERPENRWIVTAGRHGFVYADDETASVVRITGEADELPGNYPVKAQANMIDYDYGVVGDRKYLLPLRVDTRMNTRQVLFKNVVEFTAYRKFTGESSISFDVPEGEQK